MLFFAVLLSSQERFTVKLLFVGFHSACLSYVIIISWLIVTGCFTSWLHVKFMITFEVWFHRLCFCLAYCVLYNIMLTDTDGSFQIDWLCGNSMCTGFSLVWDADSCNKFHICIFQSIYLAPFHVFWSCTAKTAIYKL